MIVLILLLIMSVIILVICATEIHYLTQDVKMYRQSAYDNNRNYQIVESKFTTVLERLSIAINEFNDTYSNTQLEMAEDLLWEYQDEEKGAFKIIDLDEDESHI